MSCMLSWRLNFPPNAYSTPSPGPQGWTGWVCYNDETPAGSDASGTKFAHAKGILACEWASMRSCVLGAVALMLAARLSLSIA